MKRRDFLKVVGLAAATSVYARMDWLFPKDHTLHLFHTNDTHSHIDPFPDNDRRFAGMGGVARRATLFQQMRNRYQHALFLDAGDVFQGTPYFNYYEGKLEYKLMSALKYDAATLGNHDFDNGTDKLLAAMQEARFDIVCANYEITHPLLRSRVKPWRIFERAGVKVGVFGLGVTFKGLVTEDLHEGVTYRDPVAVAGETVSMLRTKEGCAVVIALSHLGIDGASGEPGDVVLARKTAGIDVIIGGHSHTFMDSPLMVTGPGGWQTLIHQVGFGGIRVGHIMLGLSDSGITGVSGGSYGIRK